MDRNAPAALLDTAQRGYDDSQGADRALARPRPPRLRGHAALRRRRRRPSSSTRPGALLREHPGRLRCRRTSSENAGRDRAGSRGCFPTRATTSTSTRATASSAGAAIFGHGVHLAEDATGGGCTRPAPRSRTARRRTTSSAAASSGIADAERAGAAGARGTRHRRRRRHDASRCCATMNEALQGRAAWPGSRCSPGAARSGSPPRGAAQALDLDGTHRQRSRPACDADLAVLDLGVDAAAVAAACRSASDVDERARGADGRWATTARFAATYVGGPAASHDRMSRARRGRPRSGRTSGPSR